MWRGKGSDKNLWWHCILLGTCRHQRDVITNKPIPTYLLFRATSAQCSQRLVINSTWLVPPGPQVSLPAHKLPLRDWRKPAKASHKKHTATASKQKHAIFRKQVYQLHSTRAFSVILLSVQQLLRKDLKYKKGIFPFLLSHKELQVCLTNTFHESQVFKVPSNAITDDILRPASLYEFRC